LRVAAVVEPALVIETGGLDHQRIAVPLADRIAHVNRLYRLLKRAAIQEDLTPMIVGFEQDRDQSGSLNDLAGRGQSIEGGYAMGEATLRWPSFAVVVLSLFIQSRGPGLKGNVDTVHGKVIQILAAGGHPQPRKVRFAVRGPRSRR